ncbi:uncharacterized protein LOC126812111 isoform X2 [Patella vulgata]|uniref:uncharacterized protein LOC126812111 isoform X2 n=1 Tax=Patella vulgata TaxID=6465 RepID=UPI0021802BAA|nr:uncharacterized protein LOC126812111 isoform X2 [Patella vulgata]
MKTTNNKTTTTNSLFSSLCHLSKEAALRKTFFLISISAFIVCLLLYSHSRFSSMMSSNHEFHHFKQNFHWRVLSKGFQGHPENPSQYGNLISNSSNKFPFLFDLEDSSTSTRSGGKVTSSVTRAVLSVLKSSSKVNSTLKVNISTDSVNGHHSNQKYLVYLCDDTAWCGGWGDRQRGVVSLYLLSLAYNRTYGILMTSPCDLAQFYQPNKIFWSFDPHLLKNKTSKVVYAVDSGSLKLDSKSKQLEDILYIQTNMDNVPAIRKHFRSKMPKWILQKSRPAIFREVWQRLMKPTPRLQKRLDNLLLSGKDTGKLVCAHVRIGYSKNLPNDPPRMAIASIDILWNFMENIQNVRKYFVATDNDDVRISARRRFGDLFVDTGGTILHIDRQRNRNESCVGFETAILDQLALTKCDILIISASNFSIRGSMLKTVLENIYQFDGELIKPFSPFSRFRHRRHVENSTTHSYEITVDNRNIEVYVLKI